jgi:hypothetical protein
LICARGTSQCWRKIDDGRFAIGFLRGLSNLKLRHQEAIKQSTCIRVAEEVKIEVWESPRFIGWLAAPSLQTVDPWQKTVRLITLVRENLRSSR